MAKCLFIEWMEKGVSGRACGKGKVRKICFAILVFRPVAWGHDAKWDGYFPDTGGKKA